MKSLIALLFIVLLVGCAQSEKEAPPQLDGIWAVEEFRDENGPITTNATFLSIQGSDWKFGPITGPVGKATLTRRGNTLTLTTNGKVESLEITELSSQYLVLRSPDGKMISKFKRNGVVPPKFSPQGHVPASFPETTFPTPGR